VFFDVSAGDLSGLVAVMLSAFPFTSLSDPNGGNLSIDALTNGSITIATSSVPEPSALALALLGFAALASIRKSFWR
jgi:MYXO-CTERM domain-containing protein